MENSLGFQKLKGYDFMGNELINIPFEIVCTGGNRKNYDLYIKYIKSAVIKSVETLNTTYRAYYDRMKLFFEYLYKFEGNPYILNEEFIFNFSDVWERYCYYCLQIGNSRFTIKGKRTACKVFFDWCVRKRLLINNPFVYIDEMRVSEKDTIRNSYFLTPQEIWKIKYFLEKGSYDYTDENGNTKKLKFRPQEDLIFNLLLDSGARISELHSLTISQLNMEKMLFEDVKLKEGYVEPLLFFEETQNKIKELINYREKNNIETDYLLITNYGNKINRMSKAAIRASVKKIGFIVGIKDFYPHSIRKTIINLASQTDEQLASNFAHHKSIGVTRKHYIKKRSIDNIRNQMQSIRNRIGL